MYILHIIAIIYGSNIWSIDAHHLWIEHLIHRWWIKKCGREIISPNQRTVCNCKEYKFRRIYCQVIWEAKRYPEEIHSWGCVHVAFTDFAPGMNLCSFFQAHPSDMNNKDFWKMWWPEWRKLKRYTYNSCYDYGSHVLFRPRNRPDEKNTTSLAKTYTCKKIMHNY